MDCRNYLLEKKNGIIESRDRIPEQDFQRQLEATLDQIRPTVRDLRTLSESKRVIEQVLEEDLENNGSKRAKQNEPDIGFYERAYANSLIPRVVGSSVKQSKDRFSKHDQADFRAKALCYDDAFDQDLAWCVVTGIWMPKELVTAAHLVPKALTSQVVPFIFSAEEVVSKVSTKWLATAQSGGSCIRLREDCYYTNPRRQPKLEMRVGGPGVPP